MSQEEQEAPFHVLMTPSRSLQELLVTQDALKNDYLARRFRTLNDGEREDTMWSAVSPVERAMLECCDLESPERAILGGSLSRGKEQEFVQILAMHCHTAASRGLALAMLEKTMQQDKLEAPIMEETANDEPMVEGNHDMAPTIVVKSEQDTAPTNNSSLKQEHVSLSTSSEEKDDVSVDIGRMGRFLQAGGLQILRQWLLDATTPIQIYVTKPPPSSPQQQEQPQQPAKKQATTRVIETAASPTGPLLLPLLSILTDMPFDKQLVKDLKVNRLIKRLKKQLDQAIATRRAHRTDDQQWTDPNAGGLIVEQVNTAITKLMQTWGEQTAKTGSLATTFHDPFQSLQSKMKQQLELLKKYEVGDSEKPPFLVKFEEQQRLQKEQEEMSKLTTEQRAAREREQEKQQMLKIAKKRQEQAKARKEMLLKKNKEARLKQKTDGTGAPLDGNEKRKRRVRWKDGFDNADNVRRRNLLEQVHVYTTEEYGDDYDDGVEQEEETIMKEDPEDGDGGIPFADTDNGTPIKQDPDDEDDSIPYA